MKNAINLKISTINIIKNVNFDIIKVISANVWFSE